MKAIEFKTVFTDSEKKKQICEQVAQNELSHLHLKGLVGSSVSFIANGILQNIANNQLFILNDKEEAAYFLNDLEKIVGEEKVLFFPNSYRNVYQIEDVDNSNILHRAEVLNTLTKRNSSIFIVTYPDALSEKVVTKKML